jgi:drug/metabolite transporter (DMT)-like permease
VQGPRPADNISRGVAFMLAGALCFSVLDALSKWVVAANPIFQVVAIRTVFVLLFASPLIARAGGWRVLVTRRPFGHALRASLSIGSMLCFLEALRHLPLATAITLGFAAPMFMTALSVPLLGERVGVHRWVAVAAGFAGVVVIAGPTGSDGASLAALLAIASAFFFAGVMLAVRWLAPTESDAAMIVFQNLGIGVVSWLGALFVWQPIALADFLLIVASAAVLAGSQYCMLRAFRSAPVSAVAPFQYSELLWAALIGLAVWGEVPGWHTWAGAAIIIASGLGLIWRETRARGDDPSTVR